MAAYVVFGGLAPMAAASEASRSISLGQLTLDAGTYFSTGDYGRDQRTEILYAPFSIQYDRHPFRLSVTVPYLRVRGPSVVAGIPGGGVVPGEGGTEVRDGLGDVLTSASYTFSRSDSSLPMLRLTGGVKFATADESQGLGTGENDYSLQVDLAKQFGRFTPFAAAGYRFVGKPPGTDLQDTAFASGGLDVRFTEFLSGGLLYQWREATTSATTDWQAVMPYGSWKLNRRLSVDPFTVIGISESAPEFGGGLRLRFKLSLPSVPR